MVPTKPGRYSVPIPSDSLSITPRNLIGYPWLRFLAPGKEPVSTIIATGFIASTAQGVPTTLKRDGSDFSAAIFGSLVRAGKVTIWTDVDGVYSADPRKG